MKITLYQVELALGFGALLTALAMIVVLISIS